MQNVSDKSPRRIRTIGIECRSLEGPGWGVGRQAKKLLEGIAARNDLKGHFRFILYSNNSLPDDPLYDYELFTRRPAGLGSLTGLRVPSFFSLYYYILLPLRVWWDWFKNGVSAVYFPNYMLPILHPPQVKSMVMLTDDIFEEAHNPAQPFRYRIAYLIFSLFWAKRRASTIMAISHSSAHTLALKGIPEKRIFINPLGVPLPSPTDMAPGAIDFLFVGQAFQRRRLKESLKSFERLAQGRPELTFRFIGADKYPRPVINQLINDINNRLKRKAISSVAYVTDAQLANAYRSAQTLVYVSDSEAFGMPPLEALSYGTPSVVADTPLNREIYGTHAFFVAMPITKAGIETAMCEAIDDRSAREVIIKAGPSIVSRYSWQSHADRFLKRMDCLTL